MEVTLDNYSLYTKISTLPLNLKQEVDNYIDFLIYKSQKDKVDNEKRKIGRAEGLIEMKDNFDEPIDGFKEYM